MTSTQALYHRPAPPPPLPLSPVHTSPLPSATLALLFLNLPDTHPLQGPCMDCSPCLEGFLPDISWFFPSTPSFCSNVTFSLKPTLTACFLNLQPPSLNSSSPDPPYFLYLFHNAFRHPKCFLIYVLL